MGRSRKVTYEFIISTSVGAEEEFHARTIGTVHPYVPMRGPSYASGGEPAEPAIYEMDLLEILVGKEWIAFPSQLLTEKQEEAIEQEVLSYADDVSGPDPDDLYRQRQDDRMRGIE
jgi:hypothetical protein